MYIDVILSSNLPNLFKLLLIDPPGTYSKTISTPIIIIIIIIPVISSHNSKSKYLTIFLCFKDFNIFNSFLKDSIFYCIYSIFPDTFIVFIANNYPVVISRP